MERGKPDQTIYTFEAGPGMTMAYPDDELWTRDYSEARAYARQKGYQVIGNDYEFEDSELVDDFGTELISQARDWIADNAWENIGPDDVADLSDADVIAGVQRHYEGGWAAFVAASPA